MKKIHILLFLAPLFFAFHLVGEGEVKTAIEEEVEWRRKAADLEDQIFDLQRKTRRHRLWAQHYDREARRIYSMDPGLYQQWLRRAEQNRLQAQKLNSKIFALEQERLDLNGGNSVFR